MTPRAPRIETPKVTITKQHSFLVLRAALERGDALANNGGSFYGTPVGVLPAYVGTGKLPQDEVARFRADAPTYVIFSYATPIGWRRSDGTWYVPDCRYSSTTTAHQSQVRAAVQA